jgi:hypothetical protein
MSGGRPQAARRREQSMPDPRDDDPHARSRLRREIATVQAMIALYCRDHHGGPGLCGDCRCLAEYAQQRVDRCPFRAAKPTCANCTVHCYSPRMRERVREVMRYAGPRMLWRHPVLALRHWLDGRRAPAGLPVAARRRRG